VDDDCRAAPLEIVGETRQLGIAEIAAQTRGGTAREQRRGVERVADDPAADAREPLGAAQAVPHHTVEMSGISNSSPSSTRASAGR